MAHASPHSLPPWNRFLTAHSQPPGAPRPTQPPRSSLSSQGPEHRTLALWWLRVVPGIFGGDSAYEVNALIVGLKFYSPQYRDESQDLC